MQCQRLKRLARDWYQMVKEDALAPARMMELIERHVKQCPVCQADPDLPEEIEKIREIIRAPQPVIKIEE
ncbi:hypothetical protein Thein_1512 [Thermodesulfatator indicus DSM 15286]|uniref:Uncharacterized protein n=1 Tax=Thermodesulfatator indicus (strain DSM 15286 / JCM 11887 / CIR29812) TaxID=667014 RepID=F8AAF3_THEID|nr:hypothetical protein [Thermodesulfatator indicus]AEH45373.1 hypothetical protein Thein_1512 [Thermodesulfatator indicus DSM 15286]